MENNNIVIGSPQLINSEITFLGKDNILFFESDTIRLERSNIIFKGDNSLVIIRNSIDSIKLTLTIYSDSVVYIGTNISMNNRFELIASEAKNIIIGNECLISSLCLVRTSDAHRLYDLNTMKRVNIGRSVFIGDYVWLAARVVLLKGTKLHSGCIIGSDAVVTGKEVLSNSVWGGNPARLLKSNVCFDRQGSHYIRATEIEKSIEPNEKRIQNYIFDNDEHSISFEEIDKMLLSLTTAKEKQDAILKIMSNNSKNRFAKRNYF